MPRLLCRLRALAPISLSLSVLALGLSQAATGLATDAQERSFEARCPRPCPLHTAAALGPDDFAQPNSKAAPLQQPAAGGHEPFGAIAQPTEPPPTAPPPEPTTVSEPTTATTALAEPPAIPEPVGDLARCTSAYADVVASGLSLPRGWQFVCPAHGYGHAGTAAFTPGGTGHAVIINPARIPAGMAGLRGVIAHEIAHAQDFESLGYTTECRADRAAAAHGFPSPFAYLTGC